MGDHHKILPLEMDMEGGLKKRGRRVGRKKETSVGAGIYNISGSSLTGVKGP